MKNNDKILYPLTQAQNVVVFEMSFLPYKQIVNICVEFEIKSEINKDLMIQALNLALSRNPNNYIRFIKEKNQVSQYFTDEEPNEIKYIEFDNEKAYQKSLKKLFNKPFPNKQLETQLYRIQMIKKPNGLYAIDGCFSHLCYDAYSINMLFKDAFDCYKALLHGTQLPEIAISPIKAYEEDYAYLKSKRMKMDLDYVRNVLYKTEPQFTCLNGKKDKCYIEGKRYGKFSLSLKMSGAMLNLPMDRELTDAVNEYALKNRISSETVYLLAIRTFLAYVNEVDDVTIQNVVDRRMSLVQKRAGGTMAAGVFVRTIFDNNVSYKEGLNRTYANILESYKHANLATDHVTAIAEELFNKKAGLTYFSVSLTYQPAFNSDDEIDYSFLRYPNGKEVMNVYLSIMPCDSKNNYVGNYSYQPKFVSEERIKQFHEFIMCFTKQALLNDEKSINEIINNLGKNYK